MRSKIASIDLNHDLAARIMGTGQKIIVPDLNSRSAYGLDSFKKAGYRWLVAVPLMTYRVYGILGTASKNKKIYNKDTAGLVLVIGGLIAGALSKAYLSRCFSFNGKTPDAAVQGPDKATPPAVVKAGARADHKKEKTPETPAAKPEPQNSPPKKVDPVFHSHSRKMESFKKQHGQGG